MWPCNPTPGHRSREKHDPKGHKHHSVHCSTVYKSQDMETKGWIKKCGTHTQWSITQPWKERNNATAAPWMDLEIVNFSSVPQSCLTLCNPMNRSTPGLPVHHQLLEFTQTHVHWVRDAIQASHPLSSPSPPAPSPSQHQSLFQWVNSSHQPQHQSFQWTPRPNQSILKETSPGCSLSHLSQRKIKITCYRWYVEFKMIWFTDRKQTYGYQRRKAREG